MPADSAEEIFRAAKHVIALDYLATESTDRSELILPAGTFAESDGTFVNNEGRGQRFFQVFNPVDSIRESWRWIIDLMSGMGRPEAAQLSKLDDVTAALAKALPVFADVPKIAPSEEFRDAGMKIARQASSVQRPHRHAGNVTVHEPKPRKIRTRACLLHGRIPGKAARASHPRFWSPGWNSVQSVNNFSRNKRPARGWRSGIAVDRTGEHRTACFLRHDS